MKKFLAKASKPFSPPPSSPFTTNTTITTEQEPDCIPPAPYPCPHSHLALLVTDVGLLIRPRGSSEQASIPYSCVRLTWAKDSRVEAIEKHDDSSLDWTESVVVYGIAGILELFTCSYLLVITSKEEVGQVLGPQNTLYVVKSVFAIPLVEDRARNALKKLSLKNATLTAPSLVLPTSRLSRTNNISTDIDDEPLSRSTISDTSKEGSMRVKSPSNRTVMSISEGMSWSNVETGSAIKRTSSPQSDISTSSEASGPKSPVFKSLAIRLSFWSRQSKRTQKSPTSPEFPFIPELMSLTEEGEVLDRLMKESKGEGSDVIETILASTAPPPPTVEEKYQEMESKIMKECVREFTKGGMYFAYNFDITRPLQHKHEQATKFHALDKQGPYNAAVSHLVEPNLALPLWQRVDKQFWWNEWITKPFIEAGLHSYVLPLMQGFCQVSKFSIPENEGTSDPDIPVDYIIMSRRSKNRAGLRYQRRGIDDEAHVANFVETEAIMRVEREGRANVFAYVQIRGSIPLFWTQTGYGLKPPPVLATDRTHAQNFDALMRHFSQTSSIYGPNTAINLAEQQGREGAITRAYREYMEELNVHDAQYFEYDFHHETKGMKYENIHTLIEKMKRTFDAQGYFWVSGNVVLSQQKGVFRVNCIDCLDRTNVVQSAFARCVLNKQLGAVALLNSGRTDSDLIFNDVWANNGDSISRAYAGTSALKGDFTRTGKRDLTGMLNDGVNSLARMYTSTFSDWFSQAVIDYMLGNRTISVFSEFLLKLKSTDPRDLIQLSKIRAEAISTSVSRVLPDGEPLLSGWTLLSPEEINTRIGIKFEEKVLLLSEKAIYIVSYDYTMEKVKLYTRVPLGDITNIIKGAYILSPLEVSSRDPEQNAGFVLSWVCSHQECRASSYSVRNIVDAHPVLQNIENSTSLLAAVESGKVSRAAFKILPIDPMRVRREPSGTSEAYPPLTSKEMQSASTCREAADLIVDRICGACRDVGGAQGQFVTTGDVVSLAEAESVTSVYAKMEYGFKRLLWLGS